MGDVHLSEIAPDIADWLRIGLAAQPEDRFADATAMRDEWRIAAAKSTSAE